VVVMGRVAAAVPVAAAAVVAETATPPMEAVRRSLLVPMALRPMGLPVLPEAVVAEMATGADATNPIRTVSRRGAAKKRTR